MKSRQTAPAFAIILVLALVTCRELAASPESVPNRAPLETPAIDPGCTSFCLDNDGHCIFATNHDDSIQEGLLYVNKRGITKSAWERSTTGEVASWTSKYGSVTFNLAGYQLAWGGMNEAGLMISTMALEGSQPPAPDGRPPLDIALWIQYQLDNCSTVEEVIASESRVSISSPLPWCCHYLVCDRKADCATIEMLEGKMVYHNGETLPVAALTNSIYEESVKSWQTGSAPDNSLVRFGIAADAVTGFRPTDREAAVEYAFETLRQAGFPDWTVWSMVFDPESLSVHFRTIGNPQVRSIDFSKLDFACGTPVKMLDLHADLSGDISDALEAYSHDASLDHFAIVLEQLGLESSREELESLLTSMERFPCPNGEEHIVPESRHVAPWIWPAAAAVLVTSLAAAWYWLRRRGNRVRENSG